MTITTPGTTTACALDRTERRQLARTAYRRFAAAAVAVDDGQWGLPTDCDAWTVRDLVGHVVGAMRSAASWRENASQLREIRRRVQRGDGPMVDVMTQVQIDRTAALSPTDLVAECTALVDRATDTRFRTPAPARRLVRFRVEMGEIDESWRLGYLVDVILTRDAWLHRIDLCRAIGVEPELSPDHDGRLVADVVDEWARRHGRPYRLELTGPAGGAFAAGDTAAAEHHELDAVEFCRIVSGRANGTGLLSRPVPF